MNDYSKKTLLELINEIIWFDKPFRLKEIFKRLLGVTNDLQEQIDNLSSGSEPPYKVYSARIRGLVGSALPPTVNVLENTLGVTVTYDLSFFGGDTGYLLKATPGTFPQNKFWATPSNDGGTGIKLAWLNDGQIILSSPNGGNSINEVYIEIRVYN